MCDRTHVTRTRCTMFVPRLGLFAIQVFQPCCNCGSVLGERPSGQVSYLAHLLKFNTVMTYAAALLGLCSCESASTFELFVVA